MHPDVSSSAPGDCPICRMALVPRTRGEHGHEHAHAGASEGEPDALTLPPGVEVHGYDTISRAKRDQTSLEMRAPAWAESAQQGIVLYHLDESELVRPGETGYFSPASGPVPGKPLGLEVRMSGAKPLRWDRSTVMLRFETAPGVELPPGDTGLLKLPTRVRRGLVVKASAVVQAPEGPYVLVVGDDRRTLTKRPVEVGSVQYGRATILSGLHEGEFVLATHVFVLDAERRLVRRSTP